MVYFGNKKRVPGSQLLTKKTKNANFVIGDYITAKVKPPGFCRRADFLFE